MDWRDGPLRDRMLHDLRAFVRRKGAIFLKIDPDVRLGMGIPGALGTKEDPLGGEVVADLDKKGWRYSQDQIQFRNTILIDLTASDEEMLARMKQKTRYNIRLAGRQGVTVRVGTEADMQMLYRLYSETAARDSFVIRGQDYYHTLWGTFLQAGMLEPLIAEVEGIPVAAVVIFRFAGKAWYINGMSGRAHRNKMPNYLLQWEAMRRAKTAGCTTYDLWGAPDVFDENDPMWNVFRFKQGFGGVVVRHIGARDLAIRPLYYSLYTRILPRLLEVMRHRGMARARRPFEVY